MRAEHLGGWLEDACKEEAEAKKAAEETAEATRVPGEEETEAERETETEKDLTKLEKVVALVRADLWE